MSDTYKKQIGGSHYASMKIQPSEFINKNNIPFAEGNAIKYLCRHKQKGQRQDLLKAKHYIDMAIERDYVDMTPMTEEEEYRNAGISKEEAERTYPPQNSWGMIKPPDTSGKDWVDGYKKWKKGCPHN